MRRAAVVLGLLLPLALDASWNLSADADLRYRLSDWANHEGGVHVLGASARKTFSDSRGDRLTLFALVEAHDNFSEIMPHEWYGVYKGPLGSWNVTLGRFGVPYGLLTGFSSSRLLYDMLHHELLGLDVDNGIMLSGVRGMLDYAVSVTQGYGAHHVPGFPGHGIGIARVGFTLGDAAEILVGVSGAYGRSVRGHHRDSAVDRALGAVDATAYFGRLLCRVEVSTGMVDREFLGAGFAALDYALLRRLDINVAVGGLRHGATTRDFWFTGLTFKPPWFTVRGGYRYAYHNEPHHQVSLQLYRLFSVSF